MNRDSLIAPAVVIGILGIWEAWVRLMSVPAFILPSPLAVMSTAFLRSGIILPHAAVTFAEILLGIFLAVVTAVPLSIKPLHCSTGPGPCPSFLQASRSA